MRSLKFWLPVILWACLISLASTDSFSSNHTSRFIIPVLHWLFPHASADTLEFAHLVVRKCAHVIEYFVFSLLLFRMLRGGSRGWRLRWAIVALLIVAGYAAIDEYHQSFVPSRGAHVTDSLLDTCAGAGAQLAMWWWTRSRDKNRMQPSGNRDPVAAD